MYPLALLLTIPLVMATLATPLWASWRLGQIVSRASDSLVWGLDPYGLYIVGGTAGMVLWKFAAPALAIEAWPTQRITAGILGFTWMGMVVVSAGAVIIAVAIKFTGVTSLTDPRLLVLVFWPVLDTIGSLLPAALMAPDAWRRRQTTNLSETSSAPVPNAIGPLRGPSTSTSHRIKDDLLRFLQDLAWRPPGHVFEGVHITREKVILTSQGTLARLLRVSKSTINRSLKVLSAEGHIGFGASARETRITVMN